MGAVNVILGGWAWHTSCACWVAVKELNSSYYIGETPLIIMYAHDGNLI